MTKYLLIFCLVVSFTPEIFAQSLEGVWYGKFEYDGLPEYGRNPIALKIDRSNTGTYEIYSYTPIPTNGGKDTLIVCKIRYEKIGESTIKLSEYEFINGNAEVSAFQTMFLELKQKKGKTMLTGRWESPDELSSARKTVGRITFTRE